MIESDRYLCVFGMLVRRVYELKRATARLRSGDGEFKIILLLNQTVPFQPVFDCESQVNDECGQAKAPHPTTFLFGRNGVL